MHRNIVNKSRDSINHCLLNNLLFHHRKILGEIIVNFFGIIFKFNFAIKNLIKNINEISHLMLRKVLGKIEPAPKGVCGEGSEKKTSGTGID